jgi:DNA-binding NtrC family response regulator
LKYRLLIVEDDITMSTLLKELAIEAGFNAEVCHDGTQASRVLATEPPDAIFADIRMPGKTGIELIEALSIANPGLPSAIITGYATVPDVVRAFRAGAMDLITKPFDTEDVRSVLKRFQQRLDREHRCEVLNERLSRLEGKAIIPQTKSRSMQQTMQLVGKVAELTTPVLLNGETGTGKGVIARAIHAASPRSDKPWFSVNCAALADSIAESELFGHERGSFTGASTRRRGVLELANEGTLFLDEINSASPAIQTRLLEFVQERTIRRVGGEETFNIDVRIIVASNQDLQKLVSKGEFREDLYYRLNVFPIALPSLKDRKEDIIQLAEHFLITISRELNKSIKQFSDDAEQALLDYHWPGNVRELENCIHRAIVLSEGDIIERQSLPEISIPLPVELATPWKSDASLAEVELHWIQHMLNRTNGNKAEAARYLGIDVSTLHRKLRDTH